MIIVGPPIIINAIYSLPQWVDFSNCAIGRLSTRFTIITIKVS
jgi:hypothetical protein